VPLRALSAKQSQRSPSRRRWQAHAPGLYAGGGNLLQPGLHGREPYWLEGGEERSAKRAVRGLLQQPDVLRAEHVLEVRRVADVEGLRFGGQHVTGERSVADEESAHRHPVTFGTRREYEYALLLSRHKRTHSPSPPRISACTSAASWPKLSYLRQPRFL